MNQYIEAYKGIKVATIERNAAKLQIFNIAHNSAMVAGREKDMEQGKLRVLTDMLYNDIIRDYKTITIKEVEEAFRIGARGGFGEVYTLSVATFTKWIKSYMNLPERKTSITSYNYAITNEIKNEPTDKEKQMIELEFVRNIIDSYKRKKRLEFYCPVRIVYESFVRYGMQPLNEKDAKKYRFEAESRLISDAQHKAHQARMAREKNIFEQMKSEIERMEENGQFHEEALHRQMQIIHVENYLKQIN